MLLTGSATLHKLMNATVYQELFVMTSQKLQRDKFRIKFVRMFQLKIVLTSQQPSVRMLLAKPVMMLPSKCAGMFLSNSVRMCLVSLAGMYPMKLVQTFHILYVKILHGRSVNLSPRRNVLMSRKRFVSRLLGNIVRLFQGNRLPPVLRTIAAPSKTNLAVKYPDKPVSRSRTKSQTTWMNKCAVKFLRSSAVMKQNPSRLTERSKNVSRFLFKSVPKNLTDV